MSAKQQSATNGKEAGDTEQRNRKAETEGEGAAEGVVDTQQEKKRKSEDPAGEDKEVVDTQQNTTPCSENQGQETEEEANPYHEFDRDQAHFPVFCLTKPTDEYWEEFVTYANGVPWIEICSDTPSKDSVVESIERNLGSEGPWPFIGHTIEEVYDFHKKFVRPADESRRVDPFTYFTFLVIDDESVNSEPPQCLVCCDAPDYDDPDGEVTLKTMRVPIETAIWMLVLLEQLGMTPSEALEPDGTALSSIPPFTAVQASKPPDETYTIATFAEARAFKREGITHREVALKESMAERMMDDERKTQLFRVSLKEATVAANTYRVAEETSIKTRTMISMKPKHEKRSRSSSTEEAGLEDSNTEEKKARRQ